MATTIVFNKPTVTDDFGNVADNGIDDLYRWGPAAGVISGGVSWGDYPTPITLEDVLDQEAGDLADGTQVYDYLTGESAVIGRDFCSEHGWVQDRCEACHDEELREWAAEHRLVRP